MDSARPADPSCLPSSSSPSRTRRPSSTSLRSPGAQRLATVPAIHAHPVSFPRPAYLEHSALRQLLQTEQPPSLSPSRKFDTLIAADTHPYTVAMSPPTDSDEDSVMSPPRELQPVPSKPRPAVLRLPTRWSDQMKQSLLSLSADGRDLTYHGTCEGIAAAARTIYSIPPACGIYYYEVEILSKSQKGQISIGFAAHDVKLSRLPGWEPNSWGYYGDDGRSYTAEKTGTPYGPVFGTGDVIGCGIDFTTLRAFYTKNGTFLGPVFENVGKDIDLYPSVGLRYTGEIIRVNFGHEPFKFDIDYHVQQQRNTTWARILETPLRAPFLRLPSGPAGEEKTYTSQDQEAKNAINKLVLAYLSHHAYAKTARAFQKQQLGNNGDTPPTPTLHDMDVEGAPALTREAGNGKTTDDEDVEVRRRITQAIIAGDIDSAIAETRARHPAVLEAERGLVLFKLRCRKFVELILEAVEMKKRMRSVGPSPIERTASGERAPQLGAGDDDGMDVDEDTVFLSSPGTAPHGLGSNAIPIRGGGGSVRRPRSGSRSPGHTDPSTSSSWEHAQAPTPPRTLSLYEAALNRAIAYGQSLSGDYKRDTRPEVEAVFKRTFSIVAFDDPVEAGGVAAEVAGREARVKLAEEVNEAILKSQGRPGQPTLETLYRHTAVCVTQLGLLGVGAAAFADMEKELLDG
ncbi:hypothetical protein BD779DRAFT_1440522 [Infundibulicybe gibba]|nr:hypothetical protein BD779DRAFT_1440522 [Infundibulicybe gibba]